MTEQNRLAKSTTDRKLCGVAGGIANHYGVDSTLVRLGFVLAAFCWGVGIVLYLMACVVMPRSDNPAFTPKPEPKARSGHPAE